MKKKTAILRHIMGQGSIEQKSRVFGERISSLFDPLLGQWILLFGLPLLFLPKWNIVAVQAQTAGVRIDDLVLLFLGTFVVFAHFWANPTLVPIEKKIFWFTLLSLFSFFSNKILVHMGDLTLEANIFYVFRLAEYFLFFYLGRLAVLYVDITQLFWALFGWNLFWMFLQKFSLIGGFSVVGYMDVSARVQGIASFPSEMGLWLNLLFCWFFFEERTPSAKKNLFLLALFLCFSLFTIWTGNRISIMALFLTASAGVWRDFFRHTPLMRWTLLCLIPIVFTVGLVGMVNTEAVTERSKDLFSWKNLSLIEDVWRDVIADPLHLDGASVEELDISWWLRIHKWVYILKVYLSQSLCYLQGIGPGVAWSALDGGWLRIWMETGLFGLGLFGGMMHMISKMHRKMFWMVFVWGLNAIFFDAHLAYKPMSLLFFSAGCLEPDFHKKNLS